MVRASGVDRTNAIGDKQRVAAKKIIAPLKDNRVEGAIGAEIVRHQQPCGTGLEHQIITSHRCNAAHPISDRAEVAVDSTSPGPGCAWGVESKQATEAHQPPT